jgi:hypothetical protein
LMSSRYLNFLMSSRPRRAKGCTQFRLQGCTQEIIAKRFEHLAWTRAGWWRSHFLTSSRPDRRADLDGVGPGEPGNSLRAFSSIRSPGAGAFGRRREAVVTYDFRMNIGVCSTNLSGKDWAEHVPHQDRAWASDHGFQVLVDRPCKRALRQCRGRSSCCGVVQM